MDQQFQDFFSWQTSLPSASVTDSGGSPNTMVPEPPMVPSQNYSPASDTTTSAMIMPVSNINDANNNNNGNNDNNDNRTEGSLRCQWDNCQQVYPNPTALYRHLCDEHIGRFRQGNRCLECRWAQCGVRTLKRDHITSHLKVHVPFRPFECELCGGTFKRSHDLKKHIRRHARSFRLSGSVELRRQTQRGNASRRLSGLAIGAAGIGGSHAATHSTLAARMCEQVSSHPYQLPAHTVAMASHIHSPNNFQHHAFSSPEAAAAVMAAHFAMPSMPMASPHSNHSPVASVFQLTPPRTLATAPTSMTSPTSATSVMLFNHHHHHHHHQHQHATSAQPLSMGDASDSMEAAAFVAAVSVVDSYANTAASRDGSLPPTMAADRAGVLSPTPTPPPPPPHTATFTVSSMASSPSPLALPVSMNNTSDLSTSYPELTPTDSCFKPDVLQALAAVVAKSEATPHLLMTSMPAENHTAEASWMTWPATTPVTLAQLSTFSPVNGKDLSLAELDSMSLF